MILADHCVYSTTIRLLREAGFDVVRLRDISRPDAPDAEVLNLAIERSRILLTNDKDFSDILLYPPSAHTGVIVLRISAGNEAEVHRVLLQLLADQNREALNRTLAIVSRGKYRLKR